MGQGSLGHGDGPAPCREVAAGTLPLAIFGSAVALSVLGVYWPQAAWPHPLAFWAWAGGYLALVAGLGVGWVKGFPRWVYPYLGLVFLFALYWSNVATPGLRLAGHTFLRNELWGWRAWIPFLVMTAMALIVTRSLHPLRQLARGVWWDWTRLSFALYGTMPLVVWLLFYEVDARYSLWFVAGAVLFLIGGAAGYLCAVRAWQRISALLTGTALSWAVATVGNATYWHGRQEVWMVRPGNGYEAARAMLFGLGLVLPIMLAPALLEAVRRGAQALRDRGPAPAG